MYKITVEQRKELLSYMWTRPYGVSASLENMLAAVPEEKLDNKDDKDKKNNLS
jgi:hypothetical protein